MQLDNLKKLYKEPQKVTEYWGKKAGEIDDNLAKITNHALYNHSWNVTVKAFLDGGLITNESKVLEVGCGWGRILVGLRRFCPKAQLVGIDITKDFVENAKFVLEREFGHCDVTVLQGDAMKLDFEDGSFDTVVTTRVLQYVIDPKIAVRGFYRVLRNGGRVVVCLPNKMNPVRTITYHTKLYSVREVSEWLESAGFNVVKKTSINYFPSSIYRFDKNNKIIRILENTMQKVPGIRSLGALALVVGEKA